MQRPSIRVGALSRTGGQFRSSKWIRLLGAAVDRGQHTVELRYRPPFLFAGAAISLVSLLALAAGIRRWSRLPLPS